MKFEAEGKILTVESKAYDFDGNKGTSHKIRVNIDGEIYVAKSSQEQCDEFKKFEGADGDFTFKLSSPKERLVFSIVTFDPVE